MLRTNAAKRLVLPLAVVMGLLLVSAAALWAAQHPPRLVQMGADQHSQIVDLAPADGLGAGARLDRMAHSSDFQGVVHGRVTGDAVAKAGRVLAGGRQEIVSDHPLAVLGTAGAGASSYGAGRPTFVRIPGGSLAGLTLHAEDAPTVSPGDEIYVIVANYGVIGGGNQAGVLVAALSNDVFFVRGARVRGEGYWHDVDEPVAPFEAHFGFRPA